MDLAGTLLLLTTTLSASTPSPVQADEALLVPDAPSLREDVANALEAPWLDDRERIELRLHHGVWMDEDLDDPERRARAMAQTGTWDDEVFLDQRLSVDLRARSLIALGRCAEALDLLDSNPTESSMILRIRAHESCGRWDDALREIERLLAMNPGGGRTENETLVDRVEARSVRARILGRPSSDYRLMMTELARARDEVDRLDWRPRLMEARLLVEKHNRSEAVTALHETLSLNPRCAPAWYMLGRIALGGFDFDSAHRASRSLRRLSDRSMLADLLDAESALINDDPETAISILDPLLARQPFLRSGLALRAASDAVAFDLVSARARLDAMDALCPGRADGYHTVGRFLSQNRQYRDAAFFLEEAVSRRPRWSAPLIELGLLEMQSGRDDRALLALQAVSSLDAFNERAAFSLRLLEELAAFETLETEHFIIRYRAGEDEVLVKMMPDALEAMHHEVVDRFDHEPAQKTVIEVMPDHEFFSVRITGMPWIHTVAACTGPVIAMEVPRKGPPSLHLGLFDWLDTLRHEYAHTITLDRTRNRIPHWLTEAASVTMELAPRDYATARMLASQLKSDGLFDMQEINWAFVRPERPIDRQLAYAQGAWMVEYMNETHGSDALVELLDHYFDGLPQSEAMNRVLGLSEEEFHAGFLEWAEGQIAEWGLFTSPSVNDLVRRRTDAVIGDGAGRSNPADGAGESVFIPEESDVERWLEEFPDHPDLLELMVRGRIDRDSRTDPETLEYLRRYREARPVDPYPDQVLARLHLDSDQPHLAVEPLTRLESLETRDPVYAHQLTLLLRELGLHEKARSSAAKMLRIDPYRPEFHELAAAISIETGRLEEARLFLEALIILEPDQTMHLRRLEALDRIISDVNSKTG
ncbi:MAG TPA: hypothetical protein DCX60_08400 [Phycisphaerales bacterium]|nr:hypothetical protein [Phycisphaerales bacterium]